MRYITHLVLGSMLLVGCSHAANTTYHARDVGRTIETSKAAVVSSRIVTINGQVDAIGPLSGGAAAALATGAFAEGRNVGLLAGLAGLVGAGAGYLVQENWTTREGIEYVLKMDDGRTVTLVQRRARNEQPIADGTPVLLQISGGYTRIVTDPQGAPLGDGTLS